MECPIQVAVKSADPPRGLDIAGVAVGKEPGEGDGGSLRARRSRDHRQRAPSPWGSLFGQGLRNRPSGPRWVERCSPVAVIPKENLAAYLPAVSRSALVALVVANAFVAFQTFRHEWGYYEVMLIYWVEVVILGFYNVLRMLVVGVVGAAPLGGWAARWVDLGSALNRLALTAIGVGFFVVKFGAFAFTIGLFVLLLPAFLAVEGDGSGSALHRALIAAGPGFIMAAGVLGLSHGISFARNFLAGREYDRIDVVTLAFWPYVRMSLVAVTLLVGLAIAGLLPVVGRHAGFAGVMVLLKLGVDAISHLFEHRRLAVERTPA